MSDVYAINQDGITTALQRVRCKNEDKELQTLLENNLDLLPGDQINPDNPRSWVMIKREMPVPDPTNGANRWSVDFFLADQDAMPTFVECKRHDDSRARREVVGQMLDYVANGHHYWNALEIKKLADQSASACGKDIEKVIASLGPSFANNVDGYFQNVEKNLREGKVRMVFVLEDSSYELRSIVEFLNGQMERADVLLVEVRQYEVAGQRIVVPTLFGYTEQARLAKIETNSSSSAAARRSWDKESFIDDALTKVTSEQLDAIRRVISASEEKSWDIKWGTGSKNGSMNIRITGAAKRSLFTIYSDGHLSLNFGWLNQNVNEEKVRTSMSTFATECLKVELPANYREKYVPVLPQAWAPNAEKLIEFLDGVKTASGKSD